MHPKRKGFTIAILTAVLFSVSFLAIDPVTAAEEKIVEIKGTVKAVSNKAKTVSVTVEGQGVVMLKFNAATEFVNAKSGGDIPPPTAVVVKYKAVGADHIAISIKKDLVQLADGVSEIKTAELAALVAKGPLDGKYCLVDSRPAQVAAAGHLPTAASIPVNVLAEKGEKLLPCDKDKLLIFYCGGPT